MDIIWMGDGDFFSQLYSGNHFICIHYSFCSSPALLQQAIYSFRWHIGIANIIFWWCPISIFEMYLYSKNANFLQNYKIFFSSFSIYCRTKSNNYILLFQLKCQTFSSSFSCVERCWLSKTRYVAFRKYNEHCSLFSDRSNF